jgi:hypothetical protein
VSGAEHAKPVAKHTPGPWVHGENGLIYGQCADDDSEAPFICDVIDDPAMQVLGLMSPVEQANARRIVAAINGCDGIPTDALEQDVVQQVLEAVPALIGLVHRLLPQHSKFDSTLDNLPEVLGARAALAKAEGDRLHNQPNANLKGD